MTRDEDIRDLVATAAYFHHDDLLERGGQKIRRVEFLFDVDDGAWTDLLQKPSELTFESDEVSIS
jgi:hypothetical protein